MAHFLFVTQPQEGHVNPVVPISRALVKRRSEVTWITGRLYKKKVQGTGAVFNPYPEAFDSGEESAHEFFPELAKLKGVQQEKWWLKHVFMDAAFSLNQAIQAIFKQNRVDVLVADVMTFGAFWASELSGIPSAMISLGPMFLPSKDTAPPGLGLLPGKSVLTKFRNRFLTYLVPYVVFADVISHGNKIRQEMGLPSLGRRRSLIAIYYQPSLVMQLSTPAFDGWIEGV